MKFKSIFTFLLLIFFLSCKKEIPSQLPDNGIYAITTCANGVKDANEDNVDCGGDCNPCITPSPSCSLTNNNVTFANNSFSDAQVYISTDITLTSNSTQTKINVNSNDIDMLFTFEGQAIETFKTYTINTNPNPTANNVYITWTRNSVNYTAYNGDIYVYLKNGKYVIEFCDILSNGPTYSSGKLTSN